MMSPAKPAPTCRPLIGPRLRPVIVRTAMASVATSCVADRTATIASSPRMIQIFSITSNGVIITTASAAAGWVMSSHDR